MGAQSAGALIGRRAELSWLRDRVDLALGGFPHLVIIEGESGIGKTRLAQEALDHARRREGERAARPLLRPPRPPLPAAPRLAVRGDRRRPRTPGPTAPPTLELLERVRAVVGLDAATDDSPEIIERERTRQLLALTDLVLELRAHHAERRVRRRRRLGRRRHRRPAPPPHLPPRRRVGAPARAGHVARRSDGAGRRWRSRACAPSRAPRSCTCNSLTALEATELAREREPDGPVDRARDLAAASGGNPLLVEALVRDRRSTPAVFGAARRAPDRSPRSAPPSTACPTPPAAPSSPPRSSVPTRDADVCRDDQRHRRTRGRRGDRRRRPRRGRHACSRSATPSTRTPRTTAAPAATRSATARAAPRASCRSSARSRTISSPATR